MNIVEQVGGRGIAEIILSEVFTSAVLPNCYFHEIKVYGCIDAQENAAYVFCEDTKQYLLYGPADAMHGQYVLLKDLKRNLELLVGAA